MASVSVSEPAVVTPAPSVIETAVATAVINFANKSELLTFVLKTIAEVEILADRSDEDKGKFIVEEVKKAIRESSVSEEKKTELVAWCDVSLPYVIEAVKLAKAEIGKVAGVALVEVRKCCPGFFTRKV
jgi:hypothetical protein